MGNCNRPQPKAKKGEAVLELQDVFKIYREQEIETVALRGASLKVEAGEFVAIVGRSGSGKSTLLGIAAGLTSPTAGKVLLGGRDIARLGEEERARLTAELPGNCFPEQQPDTFFNCS